MIGFILSTGCNILIVHKPSQFWSSGAKAEFFCLYITHDWKSLQRYFKDDQCRCNIGIQAGNIPKIKILSTKNLQAVARCVCCIWQIQDFRLCTTKEYRFDPGLLTFIIQRGYAKSPGGSHLFGLLRLNLVVGIGAARLIPGFQSCGNLSTKSKAVLVCDLGLSSRDSCPVTLNIGWASINLLLSNHDLLVPQSLYPKLYLCISVKTLKRSRLMVESSKKSAETTQWLTKEALRLIQGIRARRRWLIHTPTRLKDLVSNSFESRLKSYVW